VLLAIVFACKKFHSYIYGRDNITIETDHLPLVRIFEKPLAQVPLRLQKMCMAIQHYAFKLIGKPGKDIPVADALSRAFLPDTYSALLKDVNCAEITAAEVRASHCFSPKRQEELNFASREDPELQALKQVVDQGWPEVKSHLPVDVCPYFDSRDEIAFINDIAFKGDRVIIPRKMRKDMLRIIHQSHLGIVRSKQLARDIMYWPGMNSQIEETVSQCAQCQEKRNRQVKEPLLPSEVPARAWQTIAADLLKCVGSDFLVVSDYYSEYVIVEELNIDTLSATVIDVLSKVFSVQGVPEKLLTDNGPQFISMKFKNFVNKLGITHVTSSPHFHQSNGFVERSNQTVRHMMEKVGGDRTEFYLGMLNFMNTPKDSNAATPAQRLFNRRTATCLPTPLCLLQPSIPDPNQVGQVLRKNRERAKHYYDCGAKPLPQLHPSDTIRVRTNSGWKPAQLLPPAQQTKEPRSYHVRTEDGNIWRRNRQPKTT